MCIIDMVRILNDDRFEFIQTSDVNTLVNSITNQMVTLFKSWNNL
jgi:hypothetical protein